MLVLIIVVITLCCKTFSSNLRKNYVLAISETIPIKKSRLNGRQKIKQTIGDKQMHKMLIGTETVLKNRYEIYCFKVSEALSSHSASLQVS